MRLLGSTAVLVQLYLLGLCTPGLEVNANQFGTISKGPAFFKNQNHGLLCSFRGGAAVEEDDSDDDYELTDSEEESEVEVEDEEDILSSSTVKATNKAQAKKTAKAKVAVSSTLAKTSTKKNRIKLPYILKAFLNPVTVFTMTKAYWASLFSLDYGKQEPSQDLRSSLEEKAKRNTGGPRKPKRKMKPGQAKTLSDLPQLNT